MSRRENDDEGLHIIENEGRKLGIAIFACIWLLIVCVHFLYGQSNDGLLAMFWAFIAAEAIPKYRFTQKKMHLKIAITSSLLSLLFLWAYLSEMMA